MQGGSGPRDQPALVENRNNRHLVGIMDSAVERIVRVPDIAVMDARILFVIFQNELDDDGLNDGVKISSAGSIDQVAFRSKDRNHGIAGDAEIAARGAHKTFQ